MVRIVTRTELDEELQAEAEARTTALATKADATATAEALATKADATATAEALVAKADAVAMANALAGKADATAVADALSGKASQADLDALEALVSASSAAVPSWVAQQVADYAAAVNQAIPVDASAGTVKITLPTGTSGQIVQVFRTDVSSNDAGDACIVTGLETTARTVVDGVTTNASAAVTSATGAFRDELDRGAAVTGTGIPAGTTIAEVTSSTSVLLSANATATGTGVSLTVTKVDDQLTVAPGRLVTFVHDGTRWHPQQVGPGAIYQPPGVNSSGNTVGRSDRAGLLLRKQRIKPTPATSVLHQFVDTTGLVSTSGLTAAPRPLYGSGSVRMTTTTAARTAQKNLAAPVDLSGKIIRANVRLLSPDRSGLLCRLELSDDNFASGNYLRLILNSSNENLLVDGEPEVIGAHIDEFTAIGTGATKTAINSVRYYLDRQSTGVSPRYMDVGPVEVVPVTATKAKAVICFDDGHTGHFTYALPKLKAYEFRGVLAPSLLQADALTGEQLRIFQDVYGWQVIAHALSSSEHNQTPQSGVLFREHLQEVKHACAALGLGVPDDFAYYGSNGWSIGGAVGADRVRAVRSHFRSGRAFVNQCRITETLPPLNPYRIPSYGYVAADDSSQTIMQSYVDRTIAQKGLACFTWHNITSLTSSAALTWLLAYLDTNRASIDVVTLAEALDPYSTPS